jgi:hypothetical protein
MKYNKIAVFISLIVILVGQIYAKGKEYYPPHIEYRHPRWISNNEIVYLKYMSYMAINSDRWGFPKKYSFQICRMNINDPKSEKVLIEITHSEYYNNDKGHYRIYEDRKYKGMYGINRMDASISAGLIAFECGEGETEGLYIVDFNGFGMKRIIKGDVMFPKWSHDGKKILFWANQNLELKKETGSGTGVFYYNLESPKNNYITGDMDNYFSWDINDKYVYVDLKDGLYSINVETKIMTKAQNYLIHSSSPDGKYWIDGESTIHIGPPENKEIIKDFKAGCDDWSPDGLRTVTASKGITIFNIKDKKVEILINRE